MSCYELLRRRAEAHTINCSFIRLSICLFICPPFLISLSPHRKLCPTSAALHDCCHCDFNCDPRHTMQQQLAEPGLHAMCSVTLCGFSTDRYIPRRTMHSNWQSLVCMLCVLSRLPSLQELQWHRLTRFSVKCETCRTMESNTMSEWLDHCWTPSLALLKESRFWTSFRKQSEATQRVLCFQRKDLLWC